MAVQQAQAVSKTQAARRGKYGLNVAVTVLAAAALVVLVNWIGYRRVFLHTDLTAGRQYTLSPQTLNLVRDLKDDYELVTLFEEPDPTYSRPEQVRSAKDLADEYSRYSQRIQVSHIDKTNNPQGYEAFEQRLRDRYAEPLKPMIQAIHDGQAAIENLRSQMTASQTMLQQLAEMPIADEAAKQLIDALVQGLSQVNRQMQEIGKETDRKLAAAMPQYTTARDTLQLALSDLNDKFYSVAADRLERQAKSAGLSNDVKEQLLKLVESFQASRDQITTAVRALQEAAPVEDYDKLLGDLRRRDPLVLVGPQQVRVVGLDEMFREQNPDQTDPAEQAEPTFLGEERITGALVSMTLQNPPLVVFVNETQQPMLRLADGNGAFMTYSQVAERLGNMNFQVREWNPMGRQNQFGQPQPPEPRPQPKPGQKVVWIIAPQLPADPRNPMTSGNRGMIAQLLADRLAAGDAALVTLAPNTQAQFGQTEPVADELKKWGVTPLLDRIVRREVTLPNRQTASTPQFQLVQWPTDTAIGAAINGMRGFFISASPLTLGQGDGRDVKTHVLATIEGDRLWAERDFQSDDPKYDQAEAQPSFTVAAAVEADHTRLVVVANPLWASDFLTTNADPNLRAPFVGWAQMYGAAYPANSELFVNSVYWLSNLDQLIAAGARTQDVRRITIEPDSVAGVKWALLGGMPAASLFVGLGVWLVRRRG